MAAIMNSPMLGRMPQPQIKNNQLPGASRSGIISPGSQPNPGVRRAIGGGKMGFGNIFNKTTNPSKPTGGTPGAPVPFSPNTPSPFLMGSRS